MSNFRSYFGLGLCFSSNAMICCMFALTALMSLLSVRCLENMWAYELGVVKYYMHSWQRLREFAASISCALREKASSTLGSLKQQFSQRRDHVSSYNPTLSDGRQ
jgi:hypothetical protein